MPFLGRAPVAVSKARLLLRWGDGSSPGGARCLRITSLPLAVTSPFSTKRPEGCRDLPAILFLQGTVGGVSPLRHAEHYDRRSVPIELFNGLGV